MKIPGWPDCDNKDFQHYVGRLLLKLQQMAAQQEHQEDRELIEHVALHLEGKLFTNEFVVLAWAAFWQPILQSLLPSTDFEVMRAEQEIEESNIELPDSLKEPPTHLLETMSSPRMFKRKAFDKCEKCGTLVAPGCDHSCLVEEVKTVDLPSGKQVQIKPFAPAAYIDPNKLHTLEYICDKCRDTGKVSVANKLVEQSGFDPEEYQAMARMGATEACVCAAGAFVAGRREQQRNKVNEQRLMEIFKREMREACKQFVWANLGIDIPIIQQSVDRTIGLMREKFGPLPFEVTVEQCDDDPNNAKLVFRTNDMRWAHILQELLHGQENG